MKSIFLHTCVVMLLGLLAQTSYEVTAFQPVLRKQSCLHPMSLAATKIPLTDAPTTRRNVLAGVGLVAATTFLSKPAEAKYSTYARREVDWDTRMMKGEIKYGTAQSVRKQLAELVPQNSSRSLKFCPNGPTAAVSPLMENKCGDWQAPPSIYGRTEDVVGNSIPGFRKGYVHTTVASRDAKERLSKVGFPSYEPDSRLVMLTET
jgi:hypothetical protein